MKKRCSIALRNFFRARIVQTRNTLHLTQRQMADALMMAERSYAALESGESGCGALTMALFLTHFCDDPTAFCAEMKEVFENSLATAGSIQ